MRILIFIVLFTFNSCGSPDSEVQKLDGVPIDGHRIFVSSQLFNGNLSGTSGADEKCQQLAIDAGLSKSYKAILSSDSQSAIDRILITDKVYVVTSQDNYKVVANSASDFWDTDNNELLYSVSFSEQLNQVEKTPWTGTTSSGDTNINHCQNWTSSNNSEKGDVGDTTRKNSFWINSNFDTCDSEYPIYCISI